LKKSSIFPLILAAGLLFSCGQISQKEQRAKLQFLYQLKNQASIANEFTFRVFYLKDLDSYKKRLNKIQTDVNNINGVDNWERSSELKNELNDVLQNNIDISDSIILNENIHEDMKIDYIPEIISIKDRLSIFLTDLDVIISDTGK
jgi:hypothetical protein